MGTILGLIIAVVLIGLVGGVVIWIVSMLGLGLEVDGFGSAFGAAIVIAIVGGILQWLIGLVWTIPGGWVGAIINLIVAAVVLMISDSFLRGMRVAGFLGAIVGAAGMSLVTYLINWLLTLFL